MESKKKGFFAPPMAFQPSVHTATPHDWNALVPVMWLNLTMKKKSKIYKNYMNRKIIQIYTVETLQLFTLCLWTMLQHVKVGHIALSQMVISIFGLKRGHLIYLGPSWVYIFISNYLYMYWVLHVIKRPTCTNIILLFINYVNIYLRIIIRIIIFIVYRYFCI